MRYTPKIYQSHAEDHIIENPAVQLCGGAGLLMDMGLGKTVATLTAIDRLMYDLLDVQKVLVIAPKKVAETVWDAEIAKWDHLKHLRISKVLGTERQRKEALKVKADIYIINCDNIVWLVSQYGTAFPFDMVVVDESSKFKSPKSQRFKALRQIRPRVKRIVNLTGTPVPNGLLDLWPQMYLLDMGDRLGKTLTGYRERFFVPDKRDSHRVHSYKIREGEDSLLGGDIYQQLIYGKISDVCISMKAEDWLELPELVEQRVGVRLSPEMQRQYEQFEREQVLALPDENELTAVNRAALTGKLLQFANGAVYTTNPDWYEVHTAKLEALEEDLEAANGNPFLLFYQYKHDLERIMKYLKAYKPKKLETAADVHDWNRKKLPFLLAHAASAGHGLNMQDGGDYVGWFGLTWNLELYQQANKRVHRQGRQRPVFMRKYVTLGTMDEDVDTALDLKTDMQDALMNAVKARIDKHRR